MITKRAYPWIGRQTWREILFLHWHVAPDVVQPLVPAPFVLDTFDDQAWISIVVFQAEQSVPRGLPTTFAYRGVTQINVRTYVFNPINAERGVYFLSLHVNSFLAIAGAKLLYSLPFHYAETMKKHKGQNICLHTVKNEKTLFTGTYHIKKSKINTDLTAFLTERYCIWNIHRNKIVKIPIMHSRWNHYETVTTIQENKLVPPFIQNVENEFAHFAYEKHSHLYPYETHGFIAE